MPPPGMSTSQPAATSGLACSAKSCDNVGGERFRFIGFQDLPGLECHRVHAGDAPLQPILADLVVEPRNVAGIDGDDAAPLAQLARIEH